MFKKTLCMLCVIAMVFSTAACSANKTTSDAGNDTSESSKTSSVISATEEATEVAVDAPELSGEASQLAGKDYGGKEFKFLYWYTPDDIVKRKIEAFNKEHNAKVELVVKTGLVNTVATSIASGQPYDIVANHGMYFPQTIFQDLWEPLESYVTTADMYDASKPEAGGLSPTVCNAFAWNKQYYALGSSKAVYCYVIYYNKKLFNQAGLEDPWELYKKGEWTWEKFTEMAEEVTDVANETLGFYGVGDMYNWLTLNATNGIVMKDGVITENMTDANFISAVNSYKDLFMGETPITASGMTGTPFKSGKVYMEMAVTDAYKVYAENVRTSSAFGRKVENLGVVPVPMSPLNTDKKYPGHAPQGYSAVKGAADPSVAACYALFESTYVDSEVDGYQMDIEVRNEVEKLFAANGFLGYCGFEDSSGNNYQTILNRQIGDIVRQGADVTATINNNRGVVQRLISDTLSEQ